MGGVKEGDFTLVAGNPGNTNRYRESYSAEYNLRKGIPTQIEDLERQLGLLRKYAAMKPEYQVLLQSQIFGLANTLKYQKDVLAALKATNVVAERQRRERELTAFLETRPDLKAEFGGVLAAQAAVYANDVEANADLDAALGWLQRADTVGYSVGLYEFAIERAKSSDREREPQFQERRWPEVRQGLLNDDPIIAALEEEVLATGFERALALPEAQGIPAVRTLAERTGPSATPRSMAHAVIGGSQIGSLDARKQWIDAPPDRFAASPDPALMFARDLLPSLNDQRQRTRILNEKLLRNRSAFARALAARCSPSRRRAETRGTLRCRASCRRGAGRSARRHSKQNTPRCRSTSSARMTSRAATRAARFSTARSRSSGSSSTGTKKRWRAVGRTARCPAVRSAPIFVSR
jgi:hypothetical protein